MRRSLLTAILLTVITLSSSNVLPILSINKLDAEPLLDDQESDNTFNSKYAKVNPNIFYKVFIETAKDNLPKKSQISRVKYIDSNSEDAKMLNSKIENEDKYDDEGFRKEQWHNYPRQLDRLNKNSKVRDEFENILFNTKDLEKNTDADDMQNDLYQYIGNDMGNLDEDIIDGPLLVLKIRLAYLTDNINNADLNKYIYTNLIPVESRTDSKEEGIREENPLNENDIESFVKVKRKGKQKITFLENAKNDKKSVKKRIFSLWSRLQNLSHRGHELHHRRHLYAFYGLPEDGGGAVTAETRATMLRPPGSPLRWG